MSNGSAEQVHGVYANDPADPQALRRRARHDVEQYRHVDIVGARSTVLARSATTCSS